MAVQWNYRLGTCAEQRSGSNGLDASRNRGAQRWRKSDARNMSGHPSGSAPEARAEAGAAAAGSDIAWYLGRDGQQFGPVDDTEFRRLATSGQLLPTDLVWREGFAEWVAVATLPPMTPPAPVAPPPPRAPEPAVTHPTARATGQPAQARATTPERPREGVPERQAAQANGTARIERAPPPKADRRGSLRRGGRKLGRGLAWTAILVFFAITLGAAYLVVAGDKNLLRIATAMIPSFGDRLVATAPIGGFAKTTEATDAAMQKSLLWQVLKKYHATWYAARVQDATAAMVANKSEAEVANALLQEVVKLRRQFAGDAMSAPTTRLKSIMTLFTANLSRMRAVSVDTCYQFVSAGEGAPAVVAQLQAPEQTSALQGQLAAIFEAVEEGRKTPRIYPKPRPEDYDSLVSILEGRGWKTADMQLFSDSAALAKASPETVCRLITDWFESQLQVTDPDIQQRLIVDSLKPVVAG